MAEYLIVDGYNVINHWKEFAKLRTQSYEHCREKLIAGVAEYAAFKGQKAIVVFDAMEVSGPASVEAMHGIEVVNERFHSLEGSTIGIVVSLTARVFANLFDCLIICTRLRKGRTDIGLVSFIQFKTCPDARLSLRMFAGSLRKCTRVIDICQHANCLS